MGRHRKRSKLKWRWMTRVSVGRWMEGPENKTAVFSSKTRKNNKEKLKTGKV